MLLMSSCSMKNNTNKLITNSSQNLNNNKIVQNNSTNKNNSSHYENPNKSIPPLNKYEDGNTFSKTIVNNDDYIDYIVNKGDTLSGICSKYQIFCPESTALKTVIALNNLTQANNLKEGMTIELPDKYFISGIKYTVKKGDTLFSIARKHTTNKNINKAMGIIMKDNFMTSNEVVAGDELFIENGK